MDVDGREGVFIKGNISILLSSEMLMLLQREKESSIGQKMV